MRHAKFQTSSFLSRKLPERTLAAWSIYDGFAVIVALSSITAGRGPFCARGKRWKQGYFASNRPNIARSEAVFAVAPKALRCTGIHGSRITLCVIGIDARPARASVRSHTTSQHDDDNLIKRRDRAQGHAPAVSGLRLPRRSHRDGQRTRHDAVRRLQALLLQRAPYRDGKGSAITSDSTDHQAEPTRPHLGPRQRHVRAVPSLGCPAGRGALGVGPRRSQGWTVDCRPSRRRPPRCDVCGVQFRPVKAVAAGALDGRRVVGAANQWRRRPTARAPRSVGNMTYHGLAREFPGNRPVGRAGARAPVSSSRPGSSGALLGSTSERAPLGLRAFHLSPVQRRRPLVSSRPHPQLPR